jgi:hypothetical protein
MQCAGGVKPVREEKMGVAKERRAKGDKLEAESIHEDKSEAEKRKPEQEKSEYEGKPAKEKIPTNLQKQGNEEELLREREISEIEKGNLIEGDDDGEERKDIKGEEKMEEGTVFIYVNCNKVVIRCWSQTFTLYLALSYCSTYAMCQLYRVLALLYCTYDLISGLCPQAGVWKTTYLGK